MKEISKMKRSFIMSCIRSKDTKPEKIVRSALFKEGFRFRLHSKKLPGKPDIILPRFKTVIFIHGCFWHQHKNCKGGKQPQKNIEYWLPKLLRNEKRDIENESALSNLKWKVFVIWECEIRNNFQEVMSKLVSHLGQQIVKGSS